MRKPLSAAQKAKKIKYQRVWRAQITPEQKKKAAQKHHEWMVAHRTPEKLEMDRVRARRRWINMTEEEKDVEREHQRCVRANWTPEQRDYANAQRRAWRERNWFKKLCMSARDRAKNAKLPCTVTEKDLECLWIAQGGKCYWTGAALVRKVRDPWSASLDKLKPELGYVLGNVVLCAWWINRARNDISAAAFTKVLSDLAQLFESSKKKAEAA